MSHSTIGSYSVTGSSLTLLAGEQRIVTFQITLNSYHMLSGVFDTSNITNIIGASLYCPIGATGSVTIIMSYVCIDTTKTFTPKINAVGILKNPKMTIN